MESKSYYLLTSGAVLFNSFYKAINAYAYVRITFLDRDQHQRTDLMEAVIPNP